MTTLEVSGSVLGNEDFDVLGKVESLISLDMVLCDIQADSMYSLDGIELLSAVQCTWRNQDVVGHVLSLRSLTIVGGDALSREFMRSLGKLKNLLYLRLGEIQLTSKDVNSWEFVDKIKVLIIEFGEVSTDAMKAMEHLIRLEYLVVPEITSSPARQMIKNMPNLRNIGIENGQFLNKDVIPDSKFFITKQE